LPAIPTGHNFPGDIKASKRTIVDKDSDDYSSDGWLDVDATISVAELELFPPSSRSNPRGDGAKATTGQSDSKLHSKDGAHPLRSVAKNSNPSRLQNTESLALMRASPVQQAVSSFIQFMAIDLEVVAHLISSLKEKLYRSY
jgi:hypothetical protein